MVVCVITNILINWKLNNSFMVLDDLLEYEDQLEQENYNLIPIKKFPDCSYAVYDDEGNVVYTTDSKIADIIGKDDLVLINDYNDNSYYNILNVTGKNGKMYYKIYRTTYDASQEMDLAVGYAKLDENYNIIEGDLFGNQKKLSEKQVNLIRGSYRSDKSVDKYEYTNVDGETRFLVFISPNITTKTYDLAVANSQKIWVVSIPIIVLLILGETLIFNKKIKKSLNVLNDIIDNYETGKNLKRNYKIPKEFSDVIDNFDDLMERLRKAEKEQKQAYQEKQRIITDLSHDLKTPLTVIQGYAKAFIDNYVPAEKCNFYMEAIYQKCLVAVDLIDSLFTYAKVEHPEYKLLKESIDICDFTKSYLADKFPEIEINNMNLEVDIPDSKITTSVDIKAMKRIYDNLVSNSLKYNKEGTTIYFHIWEDTKNVYISVADDGRGIPKNIRKQIFEVFVTSNEARTSGEGTGLGMAIVKRLVELHDGVINLEEKNRGKIKTQFNIILKKN